MHLNICSDSDSVDYDSLLNDVVDHKICNLALIGFVIMMMLMSYCTNDHIHGGNTSAEL